MAAKKTPRQSQRAPGKYNAVICFQGGAQLVVSFASNTLLNAFVTAYKNSFTTSAKWLDCEVRTTPVSAMRERLTINFSMVAAINYAIDYP